MFRLHAFSWIFSFVLILFLTVLSYVTTIAYSRRSGKTAIDPATIQRIRYESVWGQNDSLSSQASR